MNKVSIDQLNSMDQDAFVKVLGTIFEHSPWVAADAFPARPFADKISLHTTMCEVVKKAAPEVQMQLIQAHPDLAGRLAKSGLLTAESTREQASAGLDQLTPDEAEQFTTYNERYKTKFGFPFIICARLNKKQAILQGFRSRVDNSRDAEIKTALGEIFKIAELRLSDLIMS